MLSSSLKLHVVQADSQHSERFKAGATGPSPGSPRHALVFLTFEVSTVPVGEVSSRASDAVRFWPFEADECRLEPLTLGHESNGLALRALSILSIFEETLADVLVERAPASDDSATAVLWSSTSVRASSSFSRSRSRF